jgi:hypothetical protein
LSTITVYHFDKLSNNTRSNGNEGSQQIEVEIQYRTICISHVFSSLIRFLRTAAVCRTQSAVSQQMQRLEQLVGKELFARHGRNKRQNGVRGVIGSANSQHTLNIAVHQRGAGFVVKTKKNPSF